MTVAQEKGAGRGPENGRIEAVSDLVLVAGGLKPRTVIIPGGDREDDLRLVESARDHGIVDRCILVGDGKAIRHAASAVGISVPDDDIVAASSHEETAQRTVEHVLQGTVDVILKGNISTPVLNRAMVRIAVRETMSLVTMFDAAPICAGRPMLMTDPGVTTVCSFTRMVGLVENAVDVARSILGLKRPRVAILSANEKVIESLPSTRMGQQLSEYDWQDAVVYGPLSFDLAVSRESVRLKGVPLKGAAREVCGQADILVCPCLDSANVLYKVIGEMVKYGLGTFAGVTVGVSVPYVILSRGDNVETKLQSIALSSIARERMDMGRHRAPPARPPSPLPEDALLTAVWSAAVATAEKTSLPAQHINYVVAHLENGMTVAAIRGGHVVDTERVSLSDIAHLSGGQGRPPHLAELDKLVAAGDKAAGMDMETLANRIAKAIGAMFVMAGPDAQAVLLSGELPHSERLVRMLRSRFAHLLPVSTVKQPSGKHS